MTEAATRAIVCWRAGLRSGEGAAAPESDRGGQRLEVADAEQTERGQRAPGSGAPPERADPDRGPGELVGEQTDDNREQGPDPCVAALDPPPGGPRVAAAGGTHPLLRRREPGFGFRRRRALFDRVQRARDPRRHELRQHAERLRRVPAVMPGDPHPVRILAPAGAVAAEPAAAAGMSRAALKLCAAPRLCANILLGGKVCLVDELHSTAHGPAAAVRAGHFFFC